MTETREDFLIELVNKSLVTDILWDWKESIPADEVSEAAKMGFIHMYMVEDTFSDTCAMIASREELNPAEVQRTFELLEEKWIDDPGIAHPQDPKQYRTIRLEIEVLAEQDGEIIRNELAKSMGKLETNLDITDWKFSESPLYGKVGE